MSNYTRYNSLAGNRMAPIIIELESYNLNDLVIDQTAPNVFNKGLGQLRVHLLTPRGNSFILEVFTDFSLSWRLLIGDVVLEFDDFSYEFDMHVWAFLKSVPVRDEVDDVLVKWGYV